MMWRTALACLVSEALTAAGWMVEIISSQTSENTFGDHIARKTAVTTVAKPSTMPLSLERLALVTSPAWFRIAGFLAFYANGKSRDVNAGLGSLDDAKTPYVKRLESRGYLALRIGPNILSRTSAQEALNLMSTKIKEHVS